LTLDGAPIRAVRWAPRPDAPGSLLFVGGRADFVEKYAEAYWTWVADWGFGVATFDWRGQGLSGRLGGDRHRGHGDFDRWLSDLDAVVHWFTATMPGPHFAIAHSMGGHLMLRHLAHGRGTLARVVLLAPMLGIRTGPIAPRTARRLAETATRCGFGRRYGLLQRGYGAWQQRPERQTLLTGSAERFVDEHWWIANDPDLALGGVTWGWLAGAVRSIDALFAPGALEAVATPLLMLVGERERLVDLDAMARAARRLPDCRFEVVPGGRHELLREADDLRSAAQDAIRRFLLEPAA